ncbi:MAG: DUF721 domain-containing protein [Lachnospiraceae bacterium]|nr:DUF721 domain-containing protein [Lachnospiraceae bacterium]
MKWGKAADSSARAKHTERIAEVLPRFVNSIGQGKAYQTQLLVYHWEEIVGASIAGHVRPVRMDFRTLFLSADAPVWANELRYMERELIDKINAFVCEELVREIRFCSPREKENVRRREKEDLTPEKIVPEKEEYEQSSSFVSEIESDPLRLAASRALAQDLARRRSLKGQGWHSCVSCDRLVPAEEKYCTFCGQRKREEKENDVKRLLLRQPWLHGYEVSRILGCPSSLVLRERTALLRMLLSRVRLGDETSEDARLLVMMFTSAKPEDLTESFIKKSLQRLRFDLLSFYEKKDGKRKTGRRLGG